jgi:hypothetical protein
MAWEYLMLVELAPLEYDVEMPISGFFAIAAATVTKRINTTVQNLLIISFVSTKISIILKQILTFQD